MLIYTSGASLAIVRFADCDKAKEGSDCVGSGEKVSRIYGEVFGAPVIDQDNARNFDVLITGNVRAYNEATPLLFRPNLVAVRLSVLNRDGDILATQDKMETANNLTGSTIRIAKGLASTLKNEIGR
ncbi:hypothetical protein FO488_05750 [Geobacter sp. FeAm09]|uniref:hypothetical protein n=1 Tax=Geobacter sp. FeAm09 TaxID=2597769 RepID=UPI0011EDB005|nr:hypothetical protein [Geobacter sp. FeAm09]QEM67705.1 hypothetical protein FO488_05750 [Geobacter sp. FeAm09]